MQDAFSWARQPHFSPEMLAPLRDLNHRFLDLVAVNGVGGRSPVGLPASADLTARIAPLTAAQRSAAANCPYALFDLRFHDDAHWQARLGEVAHCRVADEACLSEETANFVRVALFYAWHVASTPKMAAQLLLGMTERTAAAFRSVTLHCLPGLVASEAVNLSARWCSSGFYWSALTFAASHRDESRLRRIHQFGLQLAAAALLP